MQDTEDTNWRQRHIVKVGDDESVKASGFEGSIGAH